MGVYDINFKTLVDLDHKINSFESLTQFLSFRIIPKPNNNSTFQSNKGHLF
jgi:hypothetical protein